MNTAVSINHLSVHFGEKSALENITCQLPKGQIIGLVGPKGNGLNGMRERLTSLSGHMTIQEKNGTRITFEVPLMKGV